MLSVDGQRATYLALHDLAHEVAGGRWVATGGGGYALVSVVPRAWTHLLAAVAGGSLDPETETPGEWREHVAQTLGRTAPDPLTDGRDPSWRPWARATTRTPGWTAPYTRPGWRPSRCTAWIRCPEATCGGQGDTPRPQKFHRQPLPHESLQALFSPDVPVTTGGAGGGMCAERMVLQMTPNQPGDLSESRFLTIAEVASMMRVSKMTVYRLVHGGELLPCASAGPSASSRRTSTSTSARASTTPAEPSLWRTSPRLILSRTPSAVRLGRSSGFSGAAQRVGEVWRGTCGFCHQEAAQAHGQEEARKLLKKTRVQRRKLGK